MTAHERVTAVLRRARVAGGWVDEEVASEVLAELGLDGKREIGDGYAPATPQGPSQQE